MSAKEELLWIADYAIEPWGDLRDDLRAAKATQLILSSWVKTPPSLADCMLRFEEKEPQTEEQIKQIMIQATRKMGGKVVTRAVNKHTGS